MAPCKNFVAKKKSALVGFFGKKDLERFLKYFFVNFDFSVGLSVEIWNFQWGDDVRPLEMFVRFQWELSGKSFQWSFSKFN
jgi:hypothetical protein